MPESARFETLIDLVRGAFKEAGFLADAQRPLKVRPDLPASSLIFRLYSHLFFV